MAARLPYHPISGEISFLTPIHAKQGDSPINAEGTLVVIDGGLCRAMQSKPCIAGYTLIYNFHGMLIKAYRPFGGIESVLEQNFDIASDSVCFGQISSRLMVADTDDGQKLNDTVNALKYCCNSTYARRAGPQSLNLLRGMKTGCCN